MPFIRSFHIISSNFFAWKVFAMIKISVHNMLCHDYGLNWWEWPRRAYFLVHKADIVKSVHQSRFDFIWCQYLDSNHFHNTFYTLIIWSETAEWWLCEQRATGVWSRWEQHLEGWTGGPVVTSLKWQQSKKQIEGAMSVLVTFTCHNSCECLILRKCCCSWTTDWFQQNKKKRKRKHSNLNLILTQFRDSQVRLISFLSSKYQISHDYLNKSKE